MMLIDSKNQETEIVNFDRSGGNQLQLGFIKDTRMLIIPSTENNNIELWTVPEVPCDNKLATECNNVFPNISLTCVGDIAELNEEEQVCQCKTGYLEGDKCVKCEADSSKCRKLEIRKLERTITRNFFEVKFNMDLSMELGSVAFGKFHYEDLLDISIETGDINHIPFGVKIKLASSEPKEVTVNLKKNEKIAKILERKKIIYSADQEHTRKIDLTDGKNAISDFMNRFGIGFIFNIIVFVLAGLEALGFTTNVEKPSLEPKMNLTKYFQFTDILMSIKKVPFDLDPKLLAIFSFIGALKMPAMKNPIEDLDLYDGGEEYKMYRKGGRENIVKDNNSLLLNKTNLFTIPALCLVCLVFYVGYWVFGGKNKYVLRIGRIKKLLFESTFMSWTMIAIVQIETEYGSWDRPASLIWSYVFSYIFIFIISIEFIWTFHILGVERTKKEIEDMDPESVDKLNDATGEMPEEAKLKGSRSLYYQKLKYLLLQIMTVALPTLPQIQNSVKMFIQSFYSVYFYYLVAKMKYEEAKEKIEEAKEKIEEAKRKIEEVKDKGMKMVNDAKNKVNELKDKANELKEKGMKMVDDAKNKANELKNKANELKNKANEMKEKGMKMVDDAKNKANELKNKANEMKEKGMKMANDAKNKANEMKEKGMKMANDAKNKANEMKEKGMKMANDAKNKANEMKEKGEGMANDAKNKANEMKEKGEGMANDAKKKGGDMANDAKKKANEMKEKGGDIANDAKKKGGDMANDAKKKGGDMANDAKGKGEGMANKTKNENKKVEGKKTKMADKKETKNQNLNKKGAGDMVSNPNKKEEEKEEEEEKLISGSNNKKKDQIVSDKALKKGEEMLDADNALKKGEEMLNPDGLLKKGEGMLDADGLLNKGKGMLNTGGLLKKGEGMVDAGGLLNKGKGMLNTDGLLKKGEGMVDIGALKSGKGMLGGLGGLMGDGEEKKGEEEDEKKKKKKKKGGKLFDEKDIKRKILEESVMLLIPILLTIMSFMKDNADILVWILIIALLIVFLSELVFTLKGGAKVATATAKVLDEKRKARLAAKKLEEEKKAKAKQLLNKGINSADFFEFEDEEKGSITVPQFSSTRKKQALEVSKSGLSKGEPLSRIFKRRKDKGLSSDLEIPEEQSEANLKVQVRRTPVIPIEFDVFDVLPENVRSIIIDEENRLLNSKRNNTSHGTDGEEGNGSWELGGKKAKRVLGDGKTKKNQDNLIEENQFEILERNELLHSSIRMSKHDENEEIKSNRIKKITVVEDEDVKVKKIKGISHFEDEPQDDYDQEKLIKEFRGYKALYQNENGFENSNLLKKNLNEIEEDKESAESGSNSENGKKSGEIKIKEKNSNKKNSISQINGIRNEFHESGEEDGLDSKGSQKLNTSHFMEMEEIAQDNAKVDFIRESLGDRKMPEIKPDEQDENKLE